MSANMREMTTNEFANVTVSSLTEPVAVRKYTKTVGTWYPTGMEPDSGQVRISDVSAVDRDATIAAQAAEIERLTEEVRHLKQNLKDARQPSKDADMAADLFDLPEPSFGHSFGQSYAAPKPGAKPKPARR